MPRRKLLGRERAIFGEIFRDRFLRRREPGSPRRLIEGRKMFVSKLPVLRRISQGGIGFQKAIRQPTFLFLGECRGEADEQNPDHSEQPHVVERAEADALL
jgi:hypothetical protein